MKRRSQPKVKTIGSYSRKIRAGHMPTKHSSNQPSNTDEA